MNSYFQRPKGKIVRDILYWIAIAGVVTIAATSPYFVRDLLKVWHRRKQYKQKSIETAFYRLRREGLIMVERKEHDYSVLLTNKGKKRAGLVQLDFLKVSVPKQWDQKWRFLMFDVKQTQRWKRDVLRSFLRRLNFVQFQKSVWIHPYDCEKEVKFLQELLGLNASEIQLIIATDIGESEIPLRKKFKLS